MANRPPTQTVISGAIPSKYGMDYSYSNKGPVE